MMTQITISIVRTLAVAKGHVTLALENEVGGTWGQKVHILHVEIYNFVFFLVVIIALFPKLCFTVILFEG